MASLPVTEPEQTHTLPAKPAATTGWGLLRGALVVALLVLLVGALAWMVFGYGTDHFVDSDAKRVLEREKILADRNADDAKLLHDPASWMAKDKGVVRVPIDRAIALTIPDLKENKPHAAYPVKQSPPQPANAPTSPDKGAGAGANSATNPSASNPTVGQPSLAPVAAAPTVAPVTSASSPVPIATPAPTATPTAAPSPAPAATAVPAATPMGIAAPSPDNNASNPGSPPIPGTSVQPAAPATAPAPTAAVTGAKPEPLTTPPSQPTPTGTATPTASEKTTPTPAPNEPGAGPSGTP